MPRTITLLLIALSVLSGSSCRERAAKSVEWNLSLHEQEDGVLMDITGASILFQGMHYDGTNEGTLTIYDSNSITSSSSIGGTLSGWGSPEKPGRAALEVNFWSGRQMCEIKFGTQTILIKDEGKLLQINDKEFRIDPNQKPEFVVSSDGHEPQQITKKANKSEQATPRKPSD